MVKTGFQLAYIATAALIAAALGSTAISQAGNIGGKALDYYFDKKKAEQQYGYNSSLSAQSAAQDQSLARLNSALRVQEDSGKYQRAVKDRESAGLNVGALGSGGFQAPTIQSSEANSTIANFDPKSSVERALVDTARKHSGSFNSALAYDQKMARRATVQALKQR